MSRFSRTVMPGKTPRPSGDWLMPSFDPLVGRHVGDVLAVEDDLAGADLAQPGERLQRRGLARAVGADQRGDLPSTTPNEMSRMASMWP